ncbi:uncharacterized protein LOC142177943 [Nicotiana tabacum]|uniref:Uncharacterized protein LOC142177943 n=1 Tax=Nicotiana tabacum TaxID=4097 RepID=A0AC58U0X5_TOBAC
MDEIRQLLVGNLATTGVQNHEIPVENERPEVVGHRPRGHQPSNREYHAEFPVFDGVGLKDWLYKCEQIFAYEEILEDSKEAVVLYGGGGGNRRSGAGRGSDNYEITVSVKGKAVQVLIDTGSTHNFLDLNTAKKLGCVLTAISPFDVFVADGKKVQNNYICKKLVWKMQGVSFDSDMLVLPIGGCSMVLGIQWLIALGDIMWNFKKLRMEFSIMGHKVSLRGIQPPATKMVQQASMDKLLAKPAELCMISVGLFLESQQQGVEVSFFTLEGLPKKPSMSWDLQVILQRYNDLFEEPTQLPPSRSHDHKITLKEGVSPHQHQAYKYPNIHKNEIEKMMNEMLAFGVVRPNTSPYSYLIVMVKKKDGSWHLCVDYRELNNCTWNPAATAAFQDLKLAITSAPVLALPEFSKEFTVETDALGGGIGAVLAQDNKSIAFFIKGLSDKNKALSVYERELLALVSAMQNISGVNSDLLDTVKASWRQDPALQHIIQSIQDGHASKPYYRFHNGVLSRKNRLMVGADATIRNQLISFYHDSSIGGHSGITTTLKMLKQDFYWKKMKQDVYAYIRVCDVCQKCKSDNAAYPGLLQPLPIHDKVWQDISMDFIEGLPKDASKEVIFVVVDRLSKDAHFMPLKHPYTALDVAQLFMDQVFKLHGMPKSIVLTEMLSLQANFGKSYSDCRRCHCYLPPLTTLRQMVKLRLLTHAWNATLDA